MPYQMSLDSLKGAATAVCKYFKNVSNAELEDNLGKKIQINPSDKLSVNRG